MEKKILGGLEWIKGIIVRNFEKKKNDKEDENEIRVKGSKGKWLSWKAGKMPPNRYRVVEEVKLNKGSEPIFKITIQVNFLEK